MGSGQTSKSMEFISPMLLQRWKTLALTVRDPFTEDENRWITLGKDAAGRLLVVVYTWRADHARLISARLATPREKSRYEAHYEA
jgi:uncharacterized DUF497 family protein